MSRLENKIELEIVFEILLTHQRRQRFIRKPNIVESTVDGKSAHILFYRHLVCHISTIQNEVERIGIVLSPIFLFRADEMVCSELERIILLILSPILECLSLGTGEQ